MNEPDRPVSIQVGGKTFACRLSTLHKFPDALLWKAYSFNDTSQFDLVFWDRNPRVFECLLDFYRTNRLVYPPNLSLATLKEELRFWGFDVETPPRPPWPVLPPFRPLPSASQNAIRYPLGLALRESASGCHCVLLCLVWSLLGNSSAVWEAAQRGYRSMCVYWKTRAPGIDSTLLKNHVPALQQLAAMDNCTVRMLPEITTSMLNTDVRNHDVYTHGHLHSAAPSTHVAAWKMDVSYFRDGHELVIQSTSDHQLSYTFDHGGFRITLHVDGERIWWYMNPVHGGDEHGGDDEIDVRTLEDATGFVLEILFVLGTTVLSGFVFPNCYYRTSHLRADIFTAQTYHTVPDDAENWYEAPVRHTLAYDTSPFHISLPASETTEMVLLVERKENVALVCHPIQNIVPFASTLSSTPCAYDRLLIQW